MTKNKLLEILEQNRGCAVSGQLLAEKLNVSRNAVNKAVRELRREGYLIEAATNKGYKLLSQNDILSAEGISVNLIKPLSGIFIYKELESTNQTAKQMAVNGEKNATIIISDSQSAGRGRMGRSFYSPPGSGVYMSVILHPDLKADKCAQVTTLAAVAVCKAVEKLFNVSPKIKWVNDILLDNKKVCGILTEAVTDFESGNVDFVVVGIGINVKTKDFPAELKNKAGSLLQNGTEINVPRNRLIAEILNEFFDMLPGLGSGLIIDEYKKRCVVIGREIKFQNGDKTVSAKAVDIDNLGGLIIRLLNGERQTLTAGEIIMTDLYS